MNWVLELGKLNIGKSWDSARWTSDSLNRIAGISMWDFRIVRIPICGGKKLASHSLLNGKLNDRKNKFHPIRLLFIQS